MSLTYGFTLQPTDDSTAFSNALHAIVGDGITLESGRFALTINGFTATVSSGYGMAAGRWAENDEPLALSIQPGGNNDDRTDALVMRVNYEARKAAIEVLLNVDPAAIRENPAIRRTDDEYCVFLYFIRVRRGSTSLTPDDVTDLREDNHLCGRVVPLSAISGNVLYIYNFLLSGIDQEVARLIGLSDQVAQKADAAIAELDGAIKKAGGAPKIGELMTSRRPPTPGNKWLLCDGSAVPAEYPALSGLLDGVLPNIPGERYKTYIYGGAPMEV